MQVVYFESIASRSDGAGLLGQIFSSEPYVTVLRLWLKYAKGGLCGVARRFAKMLFDLSRRRSVRLRTPNTGFTRERHY